MGIFDIFLTTAQNSGLYALYLPFILVFAVIYGLLNKSKIFGTGAGVRGINAIIAFAIAFYVIGYSSLGVTIATFFSNFFTQTTALIVTVIGIMLVLYVMQTIWPREKKARIDPRTGEIIGYEEGAPRLKIGWYIPVIVVLIFLWQFASSGGSTIFGFTLPSYIIPSGIGVSSQDVIIIILILVTIGVIFAVTGGGEKTVKVKKVLGEAE